MFKRIIVYLGLAVCIGLVILLQRRPVPSERPPQAAVASAPATGRPADTPDAYRLQPDVRALQAVGDVHRLLTGTPREDARASFDGARWHVTYRGVEVGTLPEYPEFADLEGLLRGWATTLGARESLHTAPRAGAHREIAAKLEALQTTAAADLADRRWSEGDRSPELVGLAAHALTLLTVQSVDEVGASDAVAARALALDAVWAALDSGAVTHDACLLADAMGYSAAAITAADRLPANDPVRAFVRRDLRELESRARKGGREAGFLALLALAQAHDLKGWDAWLSSHFDDRARAALPVLSTGLAVGRFESHVSSALLVMLGVGMDLQLIGERDLDHDAPGPNGTLADLLKGFERRLEAMNPRADGVFLDADVLRAYYRTCFYSALETVGEHLRESLSSLPETRRFAKELGEGEEGAAGEFQRWYTHLAEAKVGGSGTAALRKDLSSMPHFGAPLLLKTFEVIREHSPYGDLALRPAAKRLATRLDTRPDALVAFGEIAHQALFDLPLAEALYAHGIASRGPRDVPRRAWWAVFNRDRATLEAMAADRSLTLREQNVALTSLLMVPGADSAAVEAAYARRVALEPDDWGLLDGYSRLLRARRAPDRARAVLERWLARDHASSGAFDEIFARIRLARLWGDQGDIQKGIAVIEPVVESQQYGAMACMAELLEKAGRVAEAETLAVAAWGRYPDGADAQSAVIGLCWRQGKPELAARMLRGAPAPLGPLDWRFKLGPQFVRCFREHPEQGIGAVEALLAAGLPGLMTVRELAVASEQAGDHRMAFEIQSRIPAEGQVRLLQLGSGYRYLRHWKGADAALAWIKPQISGLSEGDLGVLHCVAFMLEEDDLLWSLPLDFRDPASREFSWLLRAAASARAGAARDPHRPELERRFAKRGDEHYRVLARFMLGLEDERAALASNHDPRSTCETYYYIGLRAQSEGRIRDAAPWYVRCVETNQSYNGEYRWAFDQLSEWMSLGTTLANIEADGRGRDPGALAAGPPGD